MGHIAYQNPSLVFKRAFLWISGVVSLGNETVHGNFYKLWPAQVDGKFILLPFSSLRSVFEEFNLNFFFFAGSTLTFEF